VLVTTRGHTADMGLTDFGAPSFKEQSQTGSLPLSMLPKMWVIGLADGIEDDSSQYSEMSLGTQNIFLNRLLLP